MDYIDSHTCHSNLARLQKLPMSPLGYLITSSMAFRFGVSRQHYHLFKNCRVTHQTSLHCILTATQTKHHGVREEMGFFYWEDRLIWICDTPGRLELALYTTNAIRDIKSRSTEMELFSSLCLSPVSWCFASSFPLIAALLNTKLKRGKPQQIGNLSYNETPAIARMQQNLTTAPGLALPCRKGFLVLIADTCHKEMACVLIQDQSKRAQKPLQYWSDPLNPAEQNYETTHCQCIAAAWIMPLLRPCLHRKSCTVRTDCEAFIWILILFDSTGRPAGGRLRLSDFDFEVVHRTRARNGSRDSLSQIKTDGADRTVLAEDIPEVVVFSF